MHTYFNFKSLTLSLLGMFFAEVESPPENLKFKSLEILTKRQCFSAKIVTFRDLSPGGHHDVWQVLYFDTADTHCDA
jgi:hypothetical protein